MAEIAVSKAHGGPGNALVDTAKEGLMGTRDIFQSISELGPDAIQKIVDRLEYRGGDPTFVTMRETYLDRMGLTENARILDCGCGTGVVSRAIAGREGFTGGVVGIDFSDALIDAARRLALEAGLDNRIEFRVGDSHALEDPADSYDVVIAHTLISHVVDPAKVISEASRVVRPNGVVAIFDGDYASLTYGAGDSELNAEMVDGILAAVVANSHVMRQIPTILANCGLEVMAFLPEILAEAGEGAFFSNLAESYIPMAIGAGTVAGESAEHWLALQRKASSEHRFFGACNYYTYLARKPG